MKKNKGLWTLTIFSSIAIVCFMLFLGLRPIASQEKKSSPDSDTIPTISPGTPEQTNAEELPPEEIKTDNTLPTIEAETGPMVTYLIEAQLLPESRKLTATETMSWHNTTTHAVDSLRFHLYYNAFRSIHTTFMKEGEFYKKPPEELNKLKYGEIIIKELRRVNGTDLTANMKFIAPDDNNEEDHTVMELKLDTPVEAGQTIHLKIAFQLTIPQIFARTGMEEDYFFLGQWFPKIGVLKTDGQWHCHQFHYNSEFFADYGEYRVALTVPQDYMVGATGNLQKTENNIDETITYFYKEDNIHDFAWTAYPHFKRIVEHIKLEGNTEPTTIELLLSPGHDSYQERHLLALKYALDFYSRAIFPYPYKKITLVDPPLNALASGGMEYPTLITTATIGYLPDALHEPEAITIHEFGHQYWYGLVGTDECREAWLDEGVNTFFSGEIIDSYYKGQGSLFDSFFLSVNSSEINRYAYTKTLPLDAPQLESWNFLNYNQYAVNVYRKPAVLLQSLQNLVGKERMTQFFKYYFGKFKFKHPTANDFIETFNNFMNDDYSWAFDLYIRGEGGLNHAVHEISSQLISEKPQKYRNSVTFIRTEGYFPVDLQINLKNGKEIKAFWQEQEKWKRITFDDSSPIRDAVIDPYFKVLLDKNYLDNSRVLSPRRSGIKRLAIKLGFFFQSVLSFFVL